MLNLPMQFELEVVLAMPDQQLIRKINVHEGCTAAEAVHAAGFANDWQLPNGHYLSLGCFGRMIEPNAVLAAGDRVELLRPLQADPKDQRRRRAKASASARRR